MTPRYTEAIGLAARAHEGQVRKGTAIPYVTHPVAVAALVAQYGGDEDQQIAGLLHDVIEDGGAHYAEEIGNRFGPRVLRIVQACTDGVPDNSGRKSPWKERKVRYLERLRHEPDDLLLVSGCDKLHNGRSILADLKIVGLTVFKRFQADQSETLWYYSELAKSFEERKTPICNELTATLAEILHLVHILTTEQAR